MKEFNELSAKEKEETSIVDNIPDTLPILPLRDIVIFPYMIFPVLVGREQSIRAANFASEELKTLKKKIYMKKELLLRSYKF